MKILFLFPNFFQFLKNCRPNILLFRFFWGGSSKMGHQINKWNVVHSLKKRKLLIAINYVAGLSIFFFGYDQGMMGGVNNAKGYIELMGFGHVETIDGSPNTPVITNSLLQGGIIAVH
jgi:hypothetical protein